MQKPVGRGGRADSPRLRAQRPQPVSLNPSAALGEVAPRHSHPGQAQSTGPGDPELIQHTQALTKPCQGVGAAPTHPCAQSSWTKRLTGTDSQGPREAAPPPEAQVAVGTR